MGEAFFIREGMPKSLDLGKFIVSMCTGSVRSGVCLERSFCLEYLRRGWYSVFYVRADIFLGILGNNRS